MKAVTLNGELEQAQELAPHVGMGATLAVGSDRYPYTVVEVQSSTLITVQGDDYKRTDSNGLSEDQGYIFIPNPDNPKVQVSLRANGQWVAVGQRMCGACQFFLGRRSAYRAPAF